MSIRDYSRAAAAGLLGIILGAGLVISFDCSSSYREWLRGRDWPVTAEAFANLAQIVAIVVAGWWTYWIFVRQRHNRTRSNVKQSLLTVSSTEQHRIVRVRIDVKNEGNVPIRFSTGRAIVYAVCPESIEVTEAADSEASQVGVGKNMLVLTRGRELPWQGLITKDFDLRKDRFYLEPAESDFIYCDFALPLSVEAVLVRTELCCGDDDDPDLNWREETFHDLQNVNQTTPNLAPNPAAPADQKAPLPGR